PGAPRGPAKTSPVASGVSCSSALTGRTPAPRETATETAVVKDRTSTKTMTSQSGTSARAPARPQASSSVNGRDVTAAPRRRQRVVSESEHPVVAPAGEDRCQLVTAVHAECGAARHRKRNVGAEIGGHRDKLLARDAGLPERVTREQCTRCVGTSAGHPTL